MSSKRMTLAELLSLSLGMSTLFGFVQIVGFIIRIIFRQSLGSDQYGVFAYLITLFIFLVTMNGFSMNVPLISRISKEPTDEEFYQGALSQVFPSSILFGTGLAFIFILSAFWTTYNWLEILYLALMIVLYSTSQIVHCFPRGRERFKPASMSLILVGSGRIVMLISYLLLFAGNLLFALFAYTLPFIGWWASYLYHEGFPSLQRPRLRFMLSIYRDAFISYLYPLGVQIPIVLGVVLLTSFHGFGAAGDFDIALLPYSGLAAIFTGIEFVTISKARKLPEFRALLRRTAIIVAFPLYAIAIMLIFAAIILEDTGIGLLLALGLPIHIYWPIIIAVALGVPGAVLLSLLVSYFHGRGIIKPVGIIIIVCVACSIPIQMALAYFLSISGVVLSVILVNLVIVLFLIIYGYLRSDASA
ncbi:MAG: oligosaccharide flippase family protein [Candidatus Thorarchaeota archaeon]